MVRIAPSLLSCDFSRLEQEIRTVEEAGCDLLHLDIMDGHFVPNITFGPVIIHGIRKLTNLPLDAHLMIDEPEKWIASFADAGADWISFHYEATTKAEKVIELIKKENKLAGIAINPATPVDKIKPWLSEEVGLEVEPPQVDFVVVMTVDPGFGGQEFIREPLEKVKNLSKRGIQVEVDGGVKLHNVQEVVKAGATIIVSGSGIFKTNDPGATVRKFKEKVQGFNKYSSV